MEYFRSTRGWDEEAERWLGEEVVAGWRMAGRALHQRVSAVGTMFSMWLTEDVMAKRADHLTDAERTVVSRCALCGEEAEDRRNEHLLFECTSASVVKLRKEVEAAVEKNVSRLVKPGPMREPMMVPWRLDNAGVTPNVGGNGRGGDSTGHGAGHCNTSRRVQEAAIKARHWRCNSLSQLGRCRHGAASSAHGGGSWS